jgi:hypothetical protein
VTARDTAPKALIDANEAFERMTAEHAAGARAYALGSEAVIWGMQFVKGGQALRLFSAPLPAGSERSPLDPRPHGVNVWGHARAMLTDRMRLIETPNTETLYSMAVVDLADGPVVVVHPDLGDRYFRTTLWELHGDTHTISQKQDGGHPPPYALVPLDWSGELPEGVKGVRLRSRYVNISPHIAVYGEDDVANVTGLQGGLRIVPLRDWGGSDAALAAGPPMRPLERPGTSTPAELMFFEQLCETLKDLTIRDDEVASARQLQAIGITLDDGFQPDRLDPAAVEGLSRAVLDAQSILEHKARTLFPPQPGGTWLVSLDATGLDDWLVRGATGWKHVWGDLSSELVFPMGRVDADGEPLTGTRRYMLHFAPGELPPTRLLAYHDVRPRRVPDRQPDRPLRHRQHGRNTAARRRRRPHRAHPARITRRGARGQLAACPGGGLLRGHAHVPARGAHVPRRLHRSGDHESALRPPAQSAARLRPQLPKPHGRHCRDRR